MKTVIQSLSLFALLSVSAITQAKIIEVKYEGVVAVIDASNTGNYNLGDAISGSLFINTNKAPGDIFAVSGGAPGEASYENTPGVGDDGGFVSGFAPASLNSEDWVYLLDDHSGAGDDFQLGDAETTVLDHQNGIIDYMWSYLFVGLVSSTPLDFINGSSLEQVFALTSAQTTMIGYFGKDFWTEDNGVVVKHDYDFITFDVTSLSASVVPEPGVLALLGLGLAGLLASRRRNKV